LPPPEKSATTTATSAKNAWPPHGDKLLRSTCELCTGINRQKRTPSLLVQHDAVLPHRAPLCPVVLCRAPLCSVVPQRGNRK
jgi:hypothetical protein